MKDPDGGAVKGIFSVTAASNGHVVWSGTSPAVASGGTASINVPTGKLSADTKYAVKVTANDGSLKSKATSAATTFTVKLRAPSADPVIQQILNLSDPGTTEAQVLAIINGMVDGSNEDGESQPLTFDQAKNELLTSLVETTDETTDEEPETPIASTCEWSVQSEGARVVVAHEGELGSLTPATVADPDLTAPMFSGAIAGEPVTVTLWQGTPTGDITTSLAEPEEDLAGLGEASIAESVDGENEDEVEEEFTNLPQPSDLETVAYRLEADDAVELGVPEQDLTDAELAGAAEDSSRECARSHADNDDGAELDTEQGQIIIPGKTELASAAAAAAPYPTTSSAVRYRTFIPNATATTKWLCGTFRGDNRDFSSHYSRSNRARASVFFNWPKRTINTTKNVGATHRLKGYGRKARTKTASSSGIKFHSASIVPTFGRINVTHSVGNPLCSFAGSIKYNVVIEVWKSGAARISGTRVEVPHHEAYLYPKTETYGRTILKTRNSKFYGLSVNCGQESMWETTK